MCFLTQYTPKCINIYLDARPKRINKGVQFSLPVYSFSPVMSTQLPLTRYRLHCMLKNGWDNKRQLHCLRFLRSSRQVEFARKHRQLSDFLRSCNILGQTILAYNNNRGIEHLEEDNSHTCDRHHTFVRFQSMLSPFISNAPH